MAFSFYALGATSIEQRVRVLRAQQSPADALRNVVYSGEISRSEALELARMITSNEDDVAALDQSLGFVSFGEHPGNAIALTTPPANLGVGLHHHLEKPWLASPPKTPSDRVTSADIVGELGDFCGQQVWACQTQLSRWYELLTLLDTPPSDEQKAALCVQLNRFNTRVQGFLETYNLHFASRLCDRRGSFLKRFGQETQPRKLVCADSRSRHSRATANRNYLSVSRRALFSDRFLPDAAHEFGHQVLYDNSVYLGDATQTVGTRCDGFQKEFEEAFADWASFMISGCTEVLDADGVVARSMVNNLTAPQVEDDFAHDASQVIAGLFYDFARETSPHTVTRILIAALPHLDEMFFRAADHTSPAHLARAMLAADQKLYNGCHAQQLTQLFAARDIPMTFDPLPMVTPNGRDIVCARDDVRLSDGDFPRNSIAIGPPESLGDLERWRLFTFPEILDCRAVVDANGRPYRLLVDLETNEVTESSTHGGSYRGHYQLVVRAAALNAERLTFTPVARIWVNADDFDQPAHLRLQPVNHDSVYNAVAEALGDQLGEYWSDYLTSTH